MKLTTVINPETNPEIYVAKLLELSPEVNHEYNTRKIKDYPLKSKRKVTKYTNTLLNIFY
jgi:hypothetical protein